MSDTTTERTQSATPNVPGNGPAVSNAFTNRTQSAADIFGKALFEASKPRIPEKVEPKPTERDTTASTTSTPEDVLESEGSSAAPQQEDTTQTPEDTANLTPQELERRETQSFKDRFYATEQKLKDLETERIREKAQQEAYTEQQRMAQLDRVEQNATQSFKARMQPAEAHVNDLYAREVSARENGDDELANYLYQTRVIQTNLINDQYGSFNAQAQTHRQSVAAEKQSQQDKQLSRTLEKAGVTLDELKAKDPKLDTRNFFAVLETTASVIADKQSAKHKGDVEKAKQEAKDAKEKWRTDSPASVPDRTLGSRGNSTGNSGKRGSAREDLATGLFGKRK